MGIRLWWRLRGMEDRQQLGNFVEPKDYSGEWPDILQSLLEAIRQYISTVRHDHPSRRDSLERVLGDMYYVGGGRRWGYDNGYGSSMMTFITLYHGDSLLFKGNMFQNTAWCLTSFFDMGKGEELKEISRKLRTWKC